MTELNTARRDLAEFLKSRRARMSPADAGLPLSGRRRTPGLRREELAQLAGVGVTWYTWFEQGRDIHVSTQFLENLARALRLTNEERNYLFALAQHRAPPLDRPQVSSVSPALQRMLDGLTSPAYVRTTRWDIAAWNRAARLIFRDYAADPPERRNILRLLLTEPDYRRMTSNWPATIQRVIAKFRVDYGRAAGDPTFARLIDDLREASPEFREWWPRHDILGRSEGMNIVQHPTAGPIEFEHTAFMVDGAPELRLIVFTPLGLESEQKVLTVLRAQNGY